jgi:hypothetical protein
MKKTAIQQLMNELIEFDSTLFNIHSERGSRFLNQFHKYLEIEKKQIIKAHGIKENHGWKDGMSFWKATTGEQYYNETYKTE